MLHAPQCTTLVATSTQLCPHWTKPSAQTVVQVPSEQTCSGGQATAQAPQLAASEARCTQLPAQLVKPAWH